MNTQPVPQPPTYMPPPQHYMPPPGLPPQGPQNTWSPEKQKGKLFNLAFFATVAFFVLSHPVTFRFMNQVFTMFTGKPDEIVGQIGVATTKGVIVHTLVFFVVMVLLLMRKQVV